jgi:hypothetical protein
LGGFVLFLTKRKQGRRGWRFTYILITECYILYIYIFQFVGVIVKCNLEEIGL